MCKLANVQMGKALIVATFINLNGTCMQKELIVSNAIVKLSFDFSLLVIEYCEKLEALKKFVIANQLMKSATAIGANVMEAQNAESKDDFIHKMKIAAKEAEETQYWLLLCDYSSNYPECKKLSMKLEEINKVLGKILSTSKRNRFL
jgi:four helix bundle protein